MQNKRSKPPRYGMRHSTIRYWQSLAADAHLMRGPSEFRAAVRRLADAIETAPARRIAHTAIMLAHVGHFDLARVIRRPGTEGRI